LITILLFEEHLHHSSNIKVIKKTQNTRNQGFSYCFCLIMEGSGYVQIMMDLDPGGPKKYGPYGSGSTTLQMIADPGGSGSTTLPLG
jgi:hypothetical protein